MKLWLLALLVPCWLFGEDATYLLTPPPPVEEEESYLCGDPEGTEASDMGSQQMMESRKKRETLTAETEPQEERSAKPADKVLEDVIKNPKFKLNIPF